MHGEALIGQAYNVTIRQVLRERGWVIGCVGISGLWDLTDYIASISS